MKCLVILSALLCFFPAWGKDREILKCLGKEEKEFHLKKKLGPIYDLNQSLIGEMIQIPRVELRTDIFQDVCQGQGSSALKLLRHSMTTGANIFVIPEDLTGMQRQMTEGMIRDYVDITRDLFLNYLAQLQAASPSPTCLKEEVPELAQFFLEIKHLQEDVEIKTIFKGRDQKIFDHLRNYSTAFERCRERVKKKAKSESKRKKKV